MVASLAAVEARAKAKGWLYDPVGWVRAHVDFSGVGDGLTTYQADIMEDLVEAHRVAVRSPHSVGKTGTAALVILWFALTRDAAGISWKIPTTASVYRQLLHYLWPEIHLWAAHLRWDVIGRAAFNRMELQVTRLKLDHGEAWAMASHDAASIEGAHAPHLLFVFDEAKAIDVPIWDAAEGAFAGAGADTGYEAMALAISTPGAPSGRFYDIHRRGPAFAHWRTRHVTLADAVEAGRVSAEWAQTMAKMWPPGGVVYANRVLGDFASSEADSVIPLAWLEAANERWYARTPEPYTTGEANITSIGVDVARSGEDSTVIAVVHGDWVAEPVRPGPGDGPFTAGAVLPYALGHLAQPQVVIDADGIGVGVYDELAKRPGLVDRLYGFHAAGKPEVGGQPWHDHSGQVTAGNLRFAAWWNLRDLLNPANDPTLALPPDDLLTGDLTAPRYYIGAGGRFFVESKDDIHKRIGRSTDTGDSVVMGLWGALVAAAGAAMAQGVATGSGGTIMGSLMTEQSW